MEIKRAVSFMCFNDEEGGKRESESINNISLKINGLNRNYPTANVSMMKI